MLNFPEFFSPTLATFTVKKRGVSVSGMFGSNSGRKEVIFTYKMNNDVNMLMTSILEYS